MDLCSLIERNAAFAPDKPAVIFEGEALSYAGLSARIDQTACALKAELGVSRGDRVAILSLNRPDYLVLLYACARLGAMLVPLNWRLAVAEQLFILSDAGIKVLVLERDFAGILPALEKGCPTPALSASILLLPREARLTCCWRKRAGTAAIRIPICLVRCCLSIPRARRGDPRARCCDKKPCCGTG